MCNKIFITGTGTDIGKTYVTALIVKKLRDSGINAGYYKAAVSGADSIEESDAGYVKKIAGIPEPDDMLLSYLYKNPVSPHLAAKEENNPVEFSVIKRDFKRAAEFYDFLTVEGSGGIMCPIRHDEEAVIYLEDIIKEFKLDTLVIADAGLGTINAVVTTVEYIKMRNINVNGIILNNWTGSEMEKDNIKMIEELTGISVCAVVRHGDTELNIDVSELKKLYGE